nr:spore germination protein [Paenibacillus bovis]
MRRWKMQRKSKQNQQLNNNKNQQELSFDALLQNFVNSDDFTQFTVKKNKAVLCIGYYESLVDSEMVHRDVLPFLKTYKVISSLSSEIPIEDIIITSDPAIIQINVSRGYLIIFDTNNIDVVALVNVKLEKGREVSLPEVEFSVIGPKESFVESLDMNINLIRKRLPTSLLKTKEIIVGSLSQTRISVLFIEGIANQENVNTIVQRISDLKIDQIHDSSTVTQLIQDNQHSPFPQIIDTERPDRIAAVLGEGKVAILVDGAPHGLIAPTTIFEFFSAFEDYYLNWAVASFFRIIRFFAVLFSIMITPLYVAVITYHYELIPKDLISTLVISRSAIPLPPILEALILELTIELLREAGARLPTKVGQTIGIVGGIVIGTASVEAGLTSNVLLIFVALAALASFTTPVYQMGNTIRLIRFPYLLMAHYIGLIGVAISFCFLLIHLLRLSSIGRPFLEPIFPPRVQDLKDAIIRLPISFPDKRPIALQSENTRRFSKKKAIKTNDPKKN